MTGSFNGKLGRWMARSAFGAFLALAVAPAAQAQWFSPFGAASPGEIVQRLQAQGYRLTGPLYRRNTVYLADVIAGRAGRERLIIDAWSGEILQRFVLRRGHWRRGFGGEFAEPIPPGVFGPPPASDFSDDRPARGSEEPIKPRARPRSTANREPAETAPAAGAPAPAPLVSPSAAPSAAVNPNAPPSASSSAETKAAAPPSPAVTGKAPKADAAAAARLETEPPPSGAPARTEAQSAKAASPPPAPVPVPKSNDKSKVNDVPVMPLD